MKRNDIVLNIDKIIGQARKVVNEREFSFGVTSAYFAGGTLCIDIFDSCALRFLVMVNISSESFTIHDVKAKSDSVSLLPLSALKSAFDFYKESRGLSKYYQECFDNSCLRHLAVGEAVN